jgi:hypothetical protein
MLFHRIREAAADPLTGRMGLFIFGALLAAGSVALATTERAASNITYLALFGVVAVLGFYLIGLSLFGHKPRATAILLSWFSRPLGIVCLAIAIPLASMARRLAAIGRGR